MAGSDRLQLDPFDEVSDALRTLVPADLGDLHLRARRYGIKVWFGAVNPTRTHFEAQVIGARHVPEASVLALEIGFHAEHPRVADNDAVLAAIVEHEAAWRTLLGDEPVAGPFIGRPDDWRRVSETWADPDLSDPDLPFEVAARLTDYLTALQPLLP